MEVFTISSSFQITCLKKDGYAIFAIDFAACFLFTEFLFIILPLETRPWFEQNMY